MINYIKWIDYLQQLRCKLLDKHIEANRKEIKAINGAMLLLSNKRVIVEKTLAEALDRKEHM